MVKAPSGGSDPVPQGAPCAGLRTALSLRGARVVVDQLAPADGSVRFSPSVPPAACGAALQVFDLATCAASPSITL